MWPRSDVRAATSPAYRIALPGKGLEFCERRRGQWGRRSGKVQALERCRVEIHCRLGMVMPGLWIRFALLANGFPMEYNAHYSMPLIQDGRERQQIGEMMAESGKR